DHIQTWADGGETTQDNGRLLCGFHNRLRNQREAKAANGADGADGPKAANGDQRQRPPPSAA
ncbi:MAG: HNH endonuclease signature motif containing protein, partial [Acidimicrobiales bacterium]